MFLANSSIYDSQRVSVLAAASPSDTDATKNNTTYQFLDSVSYNKISSVLRL